MRLTYKDLPGWKEDTDACGACEAHSVAHKTIPLERAYECPHCGTDIDLEMSLAGGDFDPQVVSATNGADPDEPIAKRLVRSCSNCYRHIMVSLRPIIYNGNHDIYYTGHDTYLVGNQSRQLSGKIRETILSNVREFLNRKDSTLGPEILTLWIVQSMEHLVAEEVAGLWDSQRV